MRRMALTAAALVLALCAGMGVMAYKAEHDVASRVLLDVNPSIEITVNRRERVLSVTPRNEEGAAVIGQMDFAGSSLEMTVNALIGSMLKNGYLSEVANSILISVDGRDAAKVAGLEKRLSEEVEAMLREGSVQGAVLSQVLDKKDDARDALAEELGVSAGKAELIREIAEMSAELSEGHTAQDLAGFSVNELNILREAMEKRLRERETEKQIEEISSRASAKVTARGNASRDGYISPEKALEIALAHACVAETDLHTAEIEVDADNGRIVFEVEFTVPATQNENGRPRLKVYEYEIDALTGDVSGVEVGYEDLEPDKETGRRDQGKPGETQSPIQTDPSPFIEVPDIPDPTQPVVPKTEPAQPGQTGSYIGEERARQAALSRAGVKAGDAKGMRVELDTDDIPAVYDVEFAAGGWEYDCEVDALTGEIVKFEKEKDDDAAGAGTSGGTAQGGTSQSGASQGGTSQQNPAGSKTVIGEAAAKKAALAHAGVTEAGAQALEIELDREPTGDHYDVDFKAGGYEYSYEIDAYKGTVLKAEKELDD
ncbi:MAG: PepSY domain-containing protein [Lachnospiraceae bacterium]|nr:PepSY domain-containing protein [Lachnospiraceae bacterium]